MTAVNQYIGETETGALNNAEAFAGIVLAAIASDGKISESETKRLHFIFSRMHLFQGRSKEEYQIMITKLLQMLNQQGTGIFLETTKRFLEPKFYQTVFAVSVDLVLADGTATREEKDFLYELQKKLEIDTDLANQIIGVMIIKNRG